MGKSTLSFATAIVSLGVFTACGPGNKPAASSQPEAVAQESAVPAAAADPSTSAPSAVAPAAQKPGWPTIGEVPKGMTMAEVKEGANIYHTSGNCYTCHGVDGKGTALGPNQTDQIWLDATGGTYANILKTVKDGVPQPKKHPAPMPPMGGAQLTTQQLHDVAAYIYAISHPKKG